MAEQTLAFVVAPAQGKERLDLYLAARLPAVTRAKLKRLIDEGAVFVDGQPTKAGHLVRPGETIVVTFPATAPTDVEPEEIPLEIVFEDEHLLVVNKAAGMVVHPAYANLSGTLVNALLAHCRSLSSIGGDARPGLVHRLDKDTSGLLVVAKSDLAHVGLARQLSEHKMEREYRAIVWGHLRQKQGCVRAALMRNPKDRLRMMIHPEGKMAVTHYQVLEELPLTSCMQLNLETGRTHQIRVHMSSLGHPVFADATYGGRTKQLAGLNHDKTQLGLHLLKTYTRQMLHARTLAFIHPITGEMKRFESAIPADMQALLDELRSQTEM
ncbi:MAG TPA: RluA family pseudouridine synthase [bacterium]|jgi:23S rRNA pseudouridine1911/1915/1917 synthase|nr:RluA family pseudouridine synthase [bacterium]HOC89992.1 RluA family pseudouridine synthase [bacterium]HOZ20581.1 RluA family pseudouridine synthase [bacterium]